MTGRRRWWVAVAAVLAVLVAVQVNTGQPHGRFTAQAEIPTLAAGVDVLAGVPEVPGRIRGGDYRRAAFGESWTDDTDAPGGRNGCDTRFLGGFRVLPSALQEVEFTSGPFR